MSDIMHLIQLITACSSLNECQTQRMKGYRYIKRRKVCEIALVYQIIFNLVFVILVVDATKLDRTL